MRVRSLVGTVARDGSEPPRNLWSSFSEAWTAVSYLIGGIVIWGGVGLGLDRVLGTGPILTIAGVLIGHAGGVYLIFLRIVPRAQKAVPDAREEWHQSGRQ